jgi:putative transposase
MLDVSRAGFYAFQRRVPSARAQADAVLVGHIGAVHGESRGTYGAPRVHAELRFRGLRCGRKRIARLMRLVDLEGCPRRRRARTTIPDRALAPAPDLVARQFRPAAENRLWVADITYVRTWQGFLYLAVVIDAFSRRVVGWSMRQDLAAELVVEALAMAVWNRRPGPGLVHHSDQGSQYTSLAFGRRCREAGIARSMGGVADCYDNAVCESFFATLKTELLYRRSWPNREAVKTAIFEYVESWYNPRRRHSTLEYLSPAEYEQRHAALVPAA